jgi:predicted nucleic acid-binding protein
LAAASVKLPARVVIDAGPLIGLIHGRDPEHAAAVAGFQQLAAARTRLVTPLPIVFEVYKWLTYETRPGIAHDARTWMRRSLDIVYPGVADLDDIVTLIGDRPAWKGALEDALVALLGLRLDVPVWTINFRDLAAFRNLQFWVPDPSR